MSLIWIEGSNDHNDSVRDIIGYAILIVAFFVLAVVVGE